MLIFTLKKEWYEKIKSGEKTVEYREAKDYWTKRIFSGKPRGTCYFQLGYNPETRLKATVFKIEEVNGRDTDLKIDKDVYAIHFKLCKE